MRARTLLLALASLLALAALGCGGGETVAPLPQTVEGEAPDQDPADTEPAETVPEGDEETPQGNPENGAEIFASSGCGDCHVLADAGASGTVGPNLDEAQPSHEEVAEIVESGRGAMPAFGDRLDDDQIQDVAAYVSRVSAQ